MTQHEFFIFFSSDDWGWKTSKYHLAKVLSKKNKVIFVNSIGLRAPTISAGDTKRIIQKLKGFFKGISKVSPNIHVISPLIIPFKKFPFQQYINQYLIIFWLKYWFRRIGVKNPYIFVFSPNWGEYINAFEGSCKKLVYYCVDDQSAFKGVSTEHLRRLEKEILEKADVVFSTSQVLHKKNSMYNRNTHYMPHGVNYDHFSQPLYKKMNIPQDLLEIPKPRIGFWGHISYDWIDVNLLKYVAKARSEWSLVLIGRLSINANEFDDFPNVFLLGEKSYGDLPYYASGLNVSIIPFNRNELTYNCNPLKLYEYFSAGLPVVSVDLPELRYYKDYIAIAENKENFIEGIEQCLKISTPVFELSDMMKNETWNGRIKKIYEVIS